MQCQECKNRHHLKCADVTERMYRQATTAWLCTKCFLESLPFSGHFDSDSDPAGDFSTDTRLETALSLEDPLESLSTLKASRQNQELLMYFNINSYQNKFEELKLINQTAQASIIILTETKIDSSYPNSQFKMTNYRLHRNDRKKGGGILAYVRSGLGARRLDTPKAFKTLEPLVLDVNLGGKDIVLVGLYRTSTRKNEPNYFSQLKDELIMCKGERCTLHDDCLERSNTKRKYAKLHKKHPTQENEQLMKKWRSTATRLRRNAIKSYWRERSAELKNNPRSFFKTFSPFLSDKTKSKEYISLEIDGKIQHNQSVVAESLADYFSTTADDIGQLPCVSQQDNQHQSSAHPSVTKITQKWFDNAFTFREITVAEVHDNLAKLNPFKATGHNQISPNALRLAANELSAPLTDNHNRVITEATWLEAWKLGEWTPVPITL